MQLEDCRGDLQSEDAVAERICRKRGDRGPDTYGAECWMRKVLLKEEKVI